MKRYIEVIGEGKFVEAASKFVAALNLEVRAAKDETAFRELSELAGEVLAALRDAKITDEEIVEGGTDLHQPWYWKKKVGQTASRRIILKVADFSRLNRALEQLEPIQSRNKERKTIAVDMRQPEFESTDDSDALVLANAFADAKQKAERLAAAMGCELGKPISVEEGGQTKRNSGFSGDEDWGGDSSRFGYGAIMMAGPAAGAGAAFEPTEERELQRPTRTIYVKCRVKFAIGGKM
ncbi:MAG: SIMPL domain-containing protein [Planctomycetes bacterium]|nr:SIMPL domain-containing protein [Planctomycetota bacterium]